MLVNEKRLCYNCLGTGHSVKDCPSNMRCRTCEKAHHTLIHQSKSSDSPPKEQKPEPVKEDDKSVKSSNLVSAVSVDTVGSCHQAGIRSKLQVLAVSLKNPLTGLKKNIWALLDSGADAHLLTEKLYLELGLEGRPILSKLQLADGGLKTLKTFETDCVVQDVDGNQSFHLNDVCVTEHLPDISGSIPSAADVTHYDYLTGIEIPSIDEKEIELIIGMKTPKLHIFSEVRHGGSIGPWAGKTPLGWVLFGPEHSALDPAHKVSNSHVCLLTTQKLETFSDVICPCQFEHIDLYTDSEVCLPSADDERALKLIENSCKLLDGHYSISLPWKNNCPKLPNNYTVALSRLKGLGRRLAREPETLVRYQEKINEMIRQGHAFEVLASDDDDVLKNRVWYIPHHCTGKKFRVVFDCSSYFNGTTLNQQLLQGPDNTSTLIGVLLRFRLHPVAIVGDIQNMFHQVKVDPADQSALRFLWWKDGDLSQPVTEYQLTVHTFGLTSSPSIAGFALRRTATDNEGKVSDATLSTIRKHFYVDDMLTSVPTSNEAVQLIKELDEVLRSGGFVLSKYVSNDVKVLETLSSGQLAPELQEVDLQNEELPAHKTLGLVWHVSEDQFRIKVGIADHTLTRRGMLSVLASIYDPLGMVGPYTLPAKLLLQRLAKLRLDWNIEVPEDIESEWKTWLSALPRLDGLSIPRMYLGFSGAKHLYLHFFADASRHGYGAVCYLRVDNGESYSCTFVMGKSRVAPMPQQTIPRLELCAAVTAVRLSVLVLRELDFRVDDLVFWTDSTTVLSYLNNTSKRRPAFETHRIAKIRKHSSVEQWRWVDTHHNPADLYSRGVSPRQTHKAINWLKAPEFLFMDESLWPSRDRNLNCIENGNHKLPLCSGDPAHSSDYVEPEDPSNLTIAASVKNTQPDTDPDILVCLTARFSPFPRAVKAVAWILRLKNVLHNRAKGIACASNLSLIGGEEFKSALLVLIRLSQQQAFPGLVEALEISPWHDVMASKRGVTAKTSLQPLQRFCPFVENGVIRIGGRLQRSSLPKDFKHPIVLSKDHHVTGLIVLDVHSNYGHNASQYVLNKLRERYHVVGQNRTVKRFIKENCMVCRNQNARTGSQLMSPLPAARVDHGSSAFECCGVDYMGPLEVKQGRSTLKRYCCVFTCLASRATHLEMAYDLTTESFLMCLRRFLSTRGHATRVMYSDNGTNFVGAKSELQRGIQRLCNDRIMKELAPKCIEWIHAPPLASHQGGVYEAIIRLVRKVMASLMSDRRLRTLTDEGLVTLLKEIEYVLNCRPLTRVGTDPNDFQALSPIMILTGCIGPGLPPDVFLSSDGMRSSWRACQLQADEFWRRWKIEYLPMLQRRGKWLTPCQNLNKGDLVLLVDDDQPRNIWRKGVIEETLPDRDGIVRRVKIRTAEQKTYMRDVRKLCLLECDI